MQKENVIKLPPKEGQPGFWRKAVGLYADGFRNMRTGRKLWILILVKLAILFGILKVFFFPDFLSSNYDNDQDRAEAVRTNLTR